MLNRKYEKQLRYCKYSSLNLYSCSKKQFRELYSMPVQQVVVTVHHRLVFSTWYCTLQPGLQCQHAVDTVRHGLISSVSSWYCTPRTGLQCQQLILYASAWSSVSAVDTVRHGLVFSVSSWYCTPRTGPCALGLVWEWVQGAHFLCCLPVTKKKQWSIVRSIKLYAAYAHFCVVLLFHLTQ